MTLNITQKIRTKLQKKHGVSEDEILECFANRDGKFLTDTRENHRTDPPTKWFVAETNQGRLLKVVFIQYDNGETHIKTAYQANEKEIEIYEKFAKSR
ncbi:hypothetical protein AAIA72_11380 [Hahella sp. SMD15-11]|uniref:ADP-ribosyl-(Dinitrogen reductase) hydrolase n=1 Tax=Thermohahella caldifontis TaxID=3142973 RepID=A0AB39UTM3_9GAMM